jgi:hypothetical protein
MYGRVQEVSSRRGRSSSRLTDHLPLDAEPAELLLSQRVHYQASVSRKKLPGRHSAAGLAPLDE